MNNMIASASQDFSSKPQHFRRISRSHSGDASTGLDRKPPKPRNGQEDPAEPHRRPEKGTSLSHGALRRTRAAIARRAISPKDGSPNSSNARRARTLLSAAIATPPAEVRICPDTPEFKPKSVRLMDSVDSLGHNI